MIRKLILITALASHGVMAIAGPNWLVIDDERHDEAARHVRAEVQKREKQTLEVHSNRDGMTKNLKVKT